MPSDANGSSQLQTELWHVTPPTERWIHSTSSASNRKEICATSVGSWNAIRHKKKERERERERDTHTRGSATMFRLAQYLWILINVILTWDQLLNCIQLHYGESTTEIHPFTMGGKQTVNTPVDLIKLWDETSANHLAPTQLLTFVLKLVFCGFLCCLNVTRPHRCSSFVKLCGKHLRVVLHLLSWLFHTIPIWPHDFHFSAPQRKRPTVAWKSFWELTLI